MHDAYAGHPKQFVPQRPKAHNVTPLQYSDLEKGGRGGDKGSIEKGDRHEHWQDETTGKI